jgi:hypothetical protein
MSGEELTAELLKKLAESPVPMTLKEVTKGLPKVKVKKGEPKPEERVAEALEAEVATARVFRSPSGKKGEMRYWTKDERHHVREKVLELAAKPMKLEALAKMAAKELKAEAKYAEGLVRDLIGEEQLHEHKAKKGPSLFGATKPAPPPPPLSLPANVKKVAALVKSVQALMKAAGVGADEVLVALRAELGVETLPNSVAEKTAEVGANVPNNPATFDLEVIIMDIVDREGTVSLKDLRARMPEDARGPMFDRAVLGLAHESRVLLSRDFDITHFPPAEHVLYVQQGETLFTTIAKGS